MNEALIAHYPYFDDVNKLSLKLGAYGCGFAGVGPGLFILSPNTLIADEIESKLPEIFNNRKLNYILFQTKINLNGVFKY